MRSHSSDIMSRYRNNMRTAKAVYDAAGVARAPMCFYNSVIEHYFRNDIWMVETAYDAVSAWTEGTEEGETI